MLEGPGSSVSRLRIVTGTVWGHSQSHDDFHLAREQRAFADKWPTLRLMFSPWVELRRQIFRAFTALFGLFVGTGFLPAASTTNIVLIVVDGVRTDDLGRPGNRLYQTPNLDRLAHEGVQFTEAYSAGTVGPATRAALLTGKYPARIKLTDSVSNGDQPTAKLRPPSWTRQLPLEDITLAEVLRSGGYATAHVGKWNLGGDGFGPEAQGFDVNLGGDEKEQPASYFSPYQIGKLAEGPVGEYLTDRTGDEAVRYIGAHAQQPFFLHICFYGARTPLQVKPELLEKYRRKVLTGAESETNIVYAAVLESLDAAVGHILRAIEENGLSGHTAVFFTSDHGGSPLGQNPSPGGPSLSARQGPPYEGGVRIPLIVRWPGLTVPGGRCPTPVISMDLPATILEQTGRTNRVLDGRSLAPLLRDPQTTLERALLCWHYPHYYPGGATPYAAIRSGDWKLIQFYEDGRHELFNLRTDPGETTNLVEEQPEKAGELAHQLFDWQGSVGAQWPMSNPNWVADTIRALTNGVVLLHSRSAAIHGTTLRYEPMPFKNTLGWWGRPEDWADWTFALDRPGTFEVEVLQGCGKGSGGSEVRLEVAQQTLSFDVQETGHFQIFVPRRIGRVTLSAGIQTLSVKPQRKPGGAVMDLRQIQLIPVENPIPDSADSGVLRTFLKARRVVFLGDSITYAGEWVEFVETWLRLQYPTLTTDFLDLGLPSETVSGLSEPGHAGGSFPRPVLSERLGRVLEQTHPDLIVAGYGMNDGMYYPYSDERAQRFQTGLRQLRAQAAAAGAMVIHVTPPVFDVVPIKGHTLPAGLPEYRTPFEGYDEVLARYSAWLMDRRVEGWAVVDIHQPMLKYLADRRQTEPRFALAGDGVHANTQGHWLIAREVLRELGASEEIVAADSPSELLKSHPRAADVLKLVQQRQRLRKDPWLTHVGHLRPGMGAGKPMAEVELGSAELLSKLQATADRPFPGRRSVWNGFDRYDFVVDGQPAMVIAPKRVAPGRPWLWHGEFFGHKPEPDLALLGRGFHVAYLSVPDQLGSPSAVAHWNVFYRELTTQYGLAPKVALVGLSRGGLYCYNWAIANPDRVACLYGDAPVCDFRSWPGAFGKGKRSDHDWQLVLEQYGFKSDEEAKAYRGNPVDRLASLAAAKVPLLHVYGDADEAVPWDENTGVVAERYRKLGGEITLIAKAGGLHHPHGLADSTPIVDFIWNHTASAKAKSWSSIHGGGPLNALGAPLLRKLGTVDLDLVETTPIVLSNRLWRFEWVRQGEGQQYWDNRRGTNYFRFRDPTTDEVTTPFADGYEFGSAFVYEGTVYVTGILGRGRVDVFASKDLKSWENWTAIPASRYGIFNTSICRGLDEFVLMFEIDRPVEEAGVAFTARFAKSRDLRLWKVTPPECNYAKDRYTAPHCLRWADGWYYNFYLEAHAGYELRVVRSKDLEHWSASPFNPVLRASPEDKIIANARLTDPQRYRIAHAKNLNNSDFDFCERDGRLIINYSWGNQLGVEHLADAVYDGTEAQFLRGWFERPIRE